MFSIAPSSTAVELRIDVVVVHRDEHADIGLASALYPAAGVVAIVEAVDPHLRDRQHIDRLDERNAAAGVGVAGEQRLEASLRELVLEIARDLDDRGTLAGAIGDAGRASFQPPRVDRLAVAERRALYPHGVEILHVKTGGDAALEAADTGVVLRARDVAGLRGGEAGSSIAMASAAQAAASLGMDRSF